MPHIGLQSTLQLAPCSRGHGGHIVSGSVGPSRCRGQKTAKAEITLEMSLISDDVKHIHLSDSLETHGFIKNEELLAMFSELQGTKY